jgi:hypothetical protein
MRHEGVDAAEVAEKLEDAADVCAGQCEDAMADLTVVFDDAVLRGAGEGDDGAIGVDGAGEDLLLCGVVGDDAVGQVDVGCGEAAGGEDFDADVDGDFGRLGVVGLFVRKDDGGCAGGLRLEVMESSAGVGAVHLT